MTIYRSCIICGNIMHERVSALAYTASAIRIYSCEQQLCQLKPYTRCSSVYTEKHELISCSVIVDIDNKHYFLRLNNEKNFTEIGVMRGFLFPDEDGEYTEYVVDKICNLNYIAQWNDAESAINLISRILKIKAFS
jgi:hypothetical protein